MRATEGFGGGIGRREEGKFGEYERVEMKENGWRKK
jgi:hypothetical protein